MRAAPELRWRGTAALGTAAATVVYWVSTWLVGVPVDPLWTAIGFAAIAAPAIPATTLTRVRRIDLSLREAKSPPRNSVYETAANARERRLRLAAIVLMGVIMLLALDRVLEAGGTTAGLTAGLLAAFGLSDLLDARRFAEAERHRETRVYYLIPPLAFTPRFGVATLYEESETTQGAFTEATPFDMEL
ncbi:MAG: hypothetical protein ACR2N6_05545 [Miltoncostaeaceae bacterium]